MLVLDYQIFSIWSFRSASQTNLDSITSDTKISAIYHSGNISTIANDSETIVSINLSNSGFIGQLHLYPFSPFSVIKVTLWTEQYLLS